MTKNRRFSDEELVAFLDGESEFAPVGEIEHALKTDTMLAARLEALSIDRHSLKEGFDDLLNAAPQPVDMPEANAPAPAAQRGFGFPAMAAAAIIALVIGALTSFATIGSFSDSGNEPDWRDYVASYQALYSNATLAHVDQHEAAKVAELARVSDTIAKPIELNSVTGAQNVTYKRAQVLGFNDRPLIQLAFLSKTGVPIALCIIRASDIAGGSKAPGDISTREMEGLSAATWTKEGYEYLLIGGTDQKLISDLASYYAKAI